MKTVLMTGAHGFVGRNLGVFLRQGEKVRLIEVDINSPPEMLEEGLCKADVIFHLAGVNRPEKLEDYIVGNTGVTKDLCDRLQILGRAPIIIFSSSIQAEMDNPYGVSKRRAEEVLMMFAEQTGAKIVIFRMKNVFGKWCRPNYNSAVATFCHNIARNLPIYISDPVNEVKLVYVDDVSAAMMEAAGLSPSLPTHFVSLSDSVYAEIAPAFKITLGTLVDTIYSFKATRSSLKVPAFDDPFICRLYATYLSYLEESDFAYDLDIKTDNRGSLAEFLKSSSFGQIFISRTKPGITRGNHYHHTKTEKFLVVEGHAIIRFRHIKGNHVIEYRVSGDEFRVVDILPGYTHTIENIGDGDLVTLFWANQIFDPEQPDTFYDEVLNLNCENPG
ncbi:MAG: NAD-dependent epimerase/dehydratase family protein [Syntrophaceae bacterium]